VSWWVPSIVRLGNFNFYIPRNKERDKEMNEIIMLIVLLIFMAYWLIFLERANYNQVPKTIWTYWEEPDHVSPTKRLSERAQHVIRSWSKHNPSYTVIILTKKTYQGYVTIPEEIRTHPDLNPDHLMDLIKLWILTERGGIWIDPTIEIDRPFDPWLFPRYAEFAGIVDRSKTSDQTYPVIDPSFMAVNRGSEFIRRWRDEFSEIARFVNVEQYLEARPYMDRQKIDEPNKNIAQITSQVVLQNQKYPQKTLILHKQSPIMI
jgi:Capsular polysaccharide synthesis protein